MQFLAGGRGGDTGSSTPLCNYCGSRCIVTIFDRLRHTDGFDHRDSQSQGADKEEGSFRERERQTADGRDSVHFFLKG